MSTPHSTVLARKYRPMTFEEMVGQRAVVQTLQNALRTGRVAQAYLFSGTRGVGKTTAARILAKALNCEQGPTPTPCGVCDSCRAVQEDRQLDVLEIDGASNTGIDNIRDLRDLVRYKAMKSRYKVVIIDEVHQISKPAFNALLKTLEEPPEKTLFIFATTELQKVPATIISRCQHFEFKRVSPKDLFNHLHDVARKEGLELTENGFALLARAAEGSVRDSLTLLDQAVAFCGRTIADADLDLILGTINRDLLFEFSSAVIAGAPDRIFPLVEKVVDSGYDLRTFHKRLIEHFRDLLIVRTMDKPQDILHLGEADLAFFRTEAEKTGGEELLRFLQALQDGEAGLRYSSQPQIAFETILVRLCHFGKLVELKDVLAGLEGGSAGTALRPSSATVRPAAIRPQAAVPAAPAAYASPAKPSALDAAKAFIQRRAAAAAAPPASAKTPAPAPARPARPAASSDPATEPKAREDASAALRAARRERETGRDAALKNENVRMFQEKLKGRVISVEDPEPPRPKDEE